MSRKKLMATILSLIAAFSMCISLTGCDGGSDYEDTRDGHVGDNDRDNDIDDDDFEAEWNDYVGGLLENY